MQTCTIQSLCLCLRCIIAHCNLSFITNYCCSEVVRSWRGEGGQGDIGEKQQRKRFMHYEGKRAHTLMALNGSEVAVRWAHERRRTGWPLLEWRHFTAHTPAPARTVLEGSKTMPSTCSGRKQRRELDFLTRRVNKPVCIDLLRGDALLMSHWDCTHEEFFTFIFLLE